MQVNHGKKAPLQRIHPGDGVVYYAPTASFRGKDKLQSFVLIGRVRPGEVYQGDMGNSFTPWRRDVSWAEASDAPIAPLLGSLDLTRDKSNWGYQLRLGVLALSEADFDLIAKAMRARFPAAVDART